jgi:hypothetical protein
MIKVIDEELVLGLSKALQDTLATGLKLDSLEVHEIAVCARLVAEKPNVAEKGENLVAFLFVLIYIIIVPFRK